MDLTDNLDQYIKLDNLTPEVVVGETKLTSDISTSDTTVNVLTTKGFPNEYGLFKIENEIIRSKKLLEISNVDFVIIFNSETPKDLIIKIMPDVLVKGGDYNKDDIVGSNEVISSGGKVKIVPLTKGFSTTSIIKSRQG